MTPPQQRLGAAHPTGPQVDDRLVDHPELTQVRSGDLLPQVHLFGRDVALVAVDEDHSALVAGLGLVERDVGVREQRVRRLLPLVGGQDDAHAGAHQEAAPSREDRLADLLDQTVGRRPDLDGGPAHQQGELVAPEPGHRVTGPDRRPQSATDDLEHQVTGGVAVPVVDHLEVVEVHEQQGRPLLVAVPQRLPDAAHQQCPVRQPGQRVVVGLVRQPVGQSTALADVVQGEHGARELLLGQLPDRGHLEPPPATVGAADTTLHEPAAPAPGEDGTCCGQLPSTWSADGLQ